MKIHLEPTDEFSLYGGIEVQAWKGDTDAGETVMALIASILPPSVSMPAPPVDHSKLDATAASMSELWSIADRLTPCEVEALVSIAKGWMSDRDRKQDRWVRSSELVRSAIER